MHNTTKNTFLNRVGTILRNQRPPETQVNYNFRVEYDEGNPFVALWFRTQGCKYDRRGECTMCNYGSSTLVTIDTMLDFVREGLKAVSSAESGRSSLLLSPSGSMFDEWEVPALARQGILYQIQQTAYSKIIIETRVEDVTEERVADYANTLVGKQCSVEMGLESANPWVLKYCVNKSMDLERYQKVIPLLKRYNVRSIVNILLGTLFLSQQEAINDTVATVRWALEQGIDQVVVFPVHVKRWTLVEWFSQHQLFTPPSLWSLVEVLARLGPGYASKTTIAWYKVYTELQKVEENIQRSPTTCPSCYQQVVRLLDAYSDTSDYTVIETLLDFQCPCKDLWRDTLHDSPANSLKKHVESSYELLGYSVMGEKWWLKHGAAILEDLNQSETGWLKPWYEILIETSTIRRS